MSARRPQAGDAVSRAGCTYRRIEAADRPEVWIALRPRSDVLAEAAVVDARLAAGDDLPLAGRLVAVADSIDVAGLPTSAGCPAFTYRPSGTATAVQRLVDAGAVVLGKTNLDQFAAGVTGTRSPHGAVVSAGDPDRIAGGPSSGSAVAVALGLADLGIGTDTAGSGRLPAAFNGLVGLSATPGIVPTAGVVPTFADFDGITVFAAELATAVAAMAVMAGPDPTDPRSRRFPADAPAGAPADAVVAVPSAAALGTLDPEYVVAFGAAVARLRDRGIRVREVDIAPMLAAGRLVDRGALTAQRYAAVGEFLELCPPDADPVAADAILAARDLLATDYLRDVERLMAFRLRSRELLIGCDALLVPTATGHPTVADISADPLDGDGELLAYAGFAGALDLAAVALPAAPTEAGRPFGVTLLGTAFHDQVLVDLAARYLGEPSGTPLVEGVPLAVFGAHLRGQPLNGQLVARGAVLLAPVRTTGAYRLFALATTPAKPGLVRTGPGTGQPIVGELWSMPPAGLGTLLAELPAPMSLTPVELDDGRWVVGFGCAYDAVGEATDITAGGGWLAYLGANGSPPAQSSR